jgi:nitrite reductase/ring-hydroxylating ferredoxin subunit/DMSO/TMAO reductase YedYZ heme-binding membrane subunit
MSVQYRAVGWNRQKRIYDICLLAGIAIYLAVFVSLSSVLFPTATAETLLIRAFGSLALLLLHIILCIGPLCRLDPRFLPLLYNRRHLGVAMFAVALVHGLFSIIQFHALGDVPPLVSLLTAGPNFPFQALGFLALLILGVMAATSHDFWLHNLSPLVWKRIHMLVYPAYALLIAHVALGELQSESNWPLTLLLGAGVACVVSLHLHAGWREAQRDRLTRPLAGDGFVEVCAVDSIPEKRAVIVPLEGERVAVFRYDGKVSAVSNVCRHQNGPLGEGRIVDGCITCPWHGYQYAPDTGTSPPPFTDRIETFQTRIADGKVFVHPCPRPPGTRLEPSYIMQAAAEGTR